MAITHDEIARRFAPPRTDGEPYARKLVVSDRAMALAEMLLTMVPGSREQSRAIEGLEACVQWAHAGIDRRLADEEPVPYVLADQPTGHPEPLDGTDRPLWLLGLTNSGLSPVHRLVALVLSTYADPRGHIAEGAQPTLDGLRHDTGVALRDLHFVLRDLERCGWIIRERTQDGSTTRTRYQLALPDGPRPQPHGADTR